MEEIIEILKKHAKKYPEMQPTDAVKLIYQNEFGGGHLIKSPEQSLEYLKREYESIDKTPDPELFEEIGNGMIRVYLGAIGQFMTLEALNALFVMSSEIHKGDTESFLSKLDAVSDRFDEINFGFTRTEFDEYLDGYKKSGCPMVSHSEVYREKYRPAYRVIEKSLLNDINTRVLIKHHKKIKN